MKNIHTLRERASGKLMRAIMRDMAKAPTDLKAGDKVTFRKDWMETRFFKEMNRDRREFILTHKDDIFTLAYDENHEGSSTLFVFEEDDSPQHWLFSSTELEKVKVD